MIDILAITREARLAVIELKADEDTTFPCKASITGRVLPGIKAAESSRNSVISRPRDLAAKALLMLVAPLCTYIPPRHDPPLSLAGNRLGSSRH